MSNTFCDLHRFRICSGFIDGIEPWLLRREDHEEECYYMFCSEICMGIFKHLKHLLTLKMDADAHSRIDYFANYNDSYYYVACSDSSESDSDVSKSEFTSGKEYIDSDNWNRASSMKAKNLTGLTQPTLVCSGFTQMASATAPPAPEPTPEPFSPQTSRIVGHKKFPSGTGVGAERALQGATQFLSTIQPGFSFELTPITTHPSQLYFITFNKGTEPLKHSLTRKPIGCLALFHTRRNTYSVMYKDVIWTDSWLRESLGDRCNTHTIIGLSFVTELYPTHDYVVLHTYSRKNTTLALNPNKAVEILRPLFEPPPPPPLPPSPEAEDNDSDNDSDEREATYKKMCLIIRRGLFPEEFQ